MRYVQYPRHALGSQIPVPFKSSNTALQIDLVHLRCLKIAESCTAALLRSESAPLDKLAKCKNILCAAMSYQGSRKGIQVALGQGKRRSTVSDGACPEGGWVPACLRANTQRQTLRRRSYSQERVTSTCQFIQITNMHACLMQT